MKIIITFLFLIIPLSITRAQFSITDTTFGKIDSALTKSMDWTTEPGKLLLQTGENENLARNKFAYVVYKSSKQPPDTAYRNGLRLIDGGYFSPSFIQILSLNAGPGGEGTYIVIDLQAIRSVNRVKMYQLGYYPGVTNPPPPNLRPRAYTIYGGLDTLNMEKLLQVPENTLGATDDFFEKVVTIRYLKITIDVIDQIQSTVITEIEVYGKGYLPEGFYTSDIKDAGQPVNWSTVEWIGEKPEGTQISLRMRTGNTKLPDDKWSPWSDSTNDSGSLLEVYEPRRYCQYQVRFGTTSLFTPKIDEVKINYDKKLLAQSTDASISPQYSTILQENTFTYSITIVKNQDEYGIDTLVILTPTPATLIGVTLDNNSIQYTSQITPSKIKIAFSNSITSSTTIRVQLKFTPFLGINRFNSYFISKSVPGNPQIIDTKKSKNVENWSVVTTDVPSKLLIETKINPNPFSPNGDGLNDKTKVTFFLANIAEPKNLIGAELRKLRINIYDLNGRLVKTLFEGESGAAAYVAGNGIEWDGRGDNGKVLRPGVYIIQIYIDSDNGGEQVAKTVTIVY